jgi:RNA recognition motif-containing protein
MGRELYVGNITFSATEEDLENLFKVVGEVRSIHLIKDSRSGQFKGCGYVKMVDSKHVKVAIDTLDGALLIDRVITVSEARPQKPPTDKPAGGKRPPGKKNSGKR